MVRRLSFALALLVAGWLPAAAQMALIAPDAPAGDSSDRIANTAWVKANGGGAQPALPNGQIWIGNGSNVATPNATIGCANLPAFTGDITNTLCAMALPTVNANVGSFGGVNSIPSFTVDGKGRITAAAANTPAIPWSEITSTPTTLSGYGIASPLPVAQGGTAAASASITALQNILGNIGANTVLSNWTGGAASVLANTWPACAADGAHALTYTNGTGVLCTAVSGAGSSTQPTTCIIILTSAVTCNNNSSAEANNGTYTTPATAKWIEFKMAGGGAGGCGGNNSTCTGSGAGVDSTFGTRTAKGAVAPTGYVAAAPGGVAGSGCAVNFPGQGGSGGQVSAAAASAAGGAGGSTPNFGGGGYALYGAAGGAATANTGGGGGGGGVLAGTLIGAIGGGSGGLCIDVINSPGATFSYTVGTGGAAGTAGSSGFAGGAGAAGIIIVIVHYNP